MANASISGLASGLDTANIIDQLMQLEAVPQTRLKSFQDTQKKVLAALQSLNTDTALLSSRAETLAKAETWQTLKATSSNSLVTVSGTPKSAASFSVTVDQVAVAHQVSWSFGAKPTDTVTTGPMRLDFPGDSTRASITLTTDGTLQGLADAINDPAKATGLTATIVRTGADTTGNALYGLVVTANKTGAASQFKLTYDDNSGQPGTALANQNAPVTGQDAQISLGAGLTLISSTNTFTDVVPGVNVTISSSSVGSIGLANGATPTTATVTVAQDSSSVKSSVKALVDQVNAMLTSIDNQTAGKTSTTSAGVLAGDAAPRSLRDALAETVFGGGITSLASVGIQTDRYGKLVFDGDAFDKAYAADPAGTAAMFTTVTTTDPVTGTTTTTDGWAARVAKVAKEASDSATGYITTAITGRNTEIDRLTDSIAAWDDRLELRRTSLQRQYTALETALSSMQSQGNWLAGQIASLPKTSS